MSKQIVTISSRAVSMVELEKLYDRFFRKEFKAKTYLSFQSALHHFFEFDEFFLKIQRDKYLSESRVQFEWSSDEGQKTKTLSWAQDGKSLKISYEPTVFSYDYTTTRKWWRCL